MSFRGRGGGGDRRGGGRGRGGGGGGRDFGDLDNPDQVIPFATFMHASTSDNMLVFKQIQTQKVPKFGAPVFTQNKQKIGTIDEIFGPINEVVRDAIVSPWLTEQHISVVPATGVQASSFNSGETCHISPERLLFADIFDESKATANKPRGGGARGGRGGGDRGRGGAFRGGGGRGGGGRGGSGGGGGRGGGDRGRGGGRGGGGRGGGDRGRGFGRGR